MNLVTRKQKLIISIATLLITIFSFLLGSFYGVKILRAFAVGSSSGVYDDEDIELYRNIQNNVVFDANGRIVTNIKSSSLYFDKDTETFSDSQGNSLDVTTVSANKKTLSQYGYRVKPFDITDKYYSFPLAAGGDMYVCINWVTRATRKLFGLFEVSNAPNSLFYDPNYGYFNYSDLYGHSVDTSLFDNNVRMLITGAAAQSIFPGWQPSNFLGDYFLNKKYPPTTLFDLLEKIDLTNPDADRLPALDDRGKQINVYEGQLFDYLSFNRRGLQTVILF